MKGLMQDYPLLLSSLIEHAACNHGQTEIVSRGVDGEMRRSTWSGVADRSRKVANMLDHLGVKPGERVASLAWNTSNHLELYFGVPGSGRVLHTVNPRLHIEQITYIIQHGGSRFLFVDHDLLEIAENVAKQVDQIEAVIVLDAKSIDGRSVRMLDYEALLADQSEQYSWPRLDEGTASTLCYCPPSAPMAQI